jgi:hypothetical protein
MPAVYLLSPSPSAAATISTALPTVPTPENTVTESNTALAGLRQALIKSACRITPRKPSIYLVAVASIAIFSAIWYAIARRRRSRTAAAVAKCHEGRRPDWAGEKGWLQTEESREQREEEQKREEQERQEGLEMQRQQEQEPQHLQQRRRWSDFAPGRSNPYCTINPLPAPHLLAAMAPQPTIHPYPPPQFPPPQQSQPQLPPTEHRFPPPPSQATTTELTKHWNESHERIIGAVVIGRRGGGSGVRRHVRVFGA